VHAGRLTPAWEPAPGVGGKGPNRPALVIEVEFLGRPDFSVEALYGSNYSPGKGSGQEEHSAGYNDY